MPSPTRDLRKDAAWRRLRDQVVREEPRCWLRLPGCTLLSTRADHVIPYADRPDLVMERSNLRGACDSCNRRRGNLPVEALVIGSADTTDHAKPEVRQAPALGIFG